MQIDRLKKMANHPHARHAAIFVSGIGIGVVVTVLLQATSLPGSEAPTPLGSESAPTFERTEPTQPPSPDKDFQGDDNVPNEPAKPSPGDLLHWVERYFDSEIFDQFQVYAIYPEFDEPYSELPPEETRPRLEIWEGDTRLGEVDPSEYGWVEGTSSIWTAFSHEVVGADGRKHQETRIYFIDAAGCGGCAWVSKYYVVINQDTGEVRLGLIENPEAVGLFAEPYHVSMTRVSSSGTKVAYLKDNSLWLYDLAAETEEKVFDIPEGQRLFECPWDCQLNFVNWNRPLSEGIDDILIIEPRVDPPLPCYRWSEEDGLREGCF